tara:strand:- start:22195 stop:23781 length:1587 start_codon:yes stop_codon:yes gene_type:complete
VTSVQPNKWLVAISVTTGAVMAAIDTSILNVATPHLQGVFSATVAEISWISTGYLVAVVLTMPLAGWLCSLYGRKTVCQAGLVIFILSSLLCGVATDLNFLIFARILQGFGAGILLPVEQVILRQAFPPKEQGLAMGIYGLTVMLGPALGPVLGGIIIDHFHWSLMFYINLPIGLIGYLMVHRFVIEPPREESKINGANTGIPKVDWFGIITLTLAMFPLLWLLERGERLYWFETPSNVALLVLSLSSFIMFCIHEWVTPNPAVDLRILVNRAFSSAILMNFLLGFIVAASLFILPIYMQEVLEYSATQAGVALVPRAIVMMLAFPLCGYLFSRLPARLLIAAGLGLGLYSAILMTRFTHESGLYDIILPQVLQGLSVALVLTPISTLALMHVRKDKLPAAAGLNGFSRQLGGSLGIAIFASMLSHFELAVRGAFIHHINEASIMVNARFSNVIQFFYSQNVVGETTALQQAYSRLNGRVEEQIVVMSYLKAFEWITVLFVVMIACLFFLKPAQTKEQISHKTALSKT